MIAAAVEASCRNDPAAAGLVSMLCAGPPWPGGRALVAEGLGDKLGEAVAIARAGDWRPGELERFVRWRLGKLGALLVVSTIQGELQRHRSVALDLDPAWIAEARALGAPGAKIDPEAASFAGSVTAAVEVCGLVSRLPSLARFGAPAGTRDGRVRPIGGERVLEKARALLAKAESTTFPEEAEAFTAKAQELLARYSIDRAMLDLGGTGQFGTHHATLRRLWIDDPYISAKGMLVHVVAAANRCRSVLVADLGIATVAGHEDDLDTVEILFTSLLLQATTQLTASGSRMDELGRARTRAFRQTFLVAYAERIGHRLDEAGRASEAAGGEAHGHRLLPVLASRRSAADEAIESTFTALERGHVSARDAEGWAAGTLAADLASLAVGPELFAP